jgi:hypothetical protein
VIRLPLTDLAVERTDGHRLWRRVTDLDLASKDRVVRVEGIFGEEADEFLAIKGDRAAYEANGGSHTVARNWTACSLTATIVTRA